jgi:hypothetical protein
MVLSDNTVVSNTSVMGPRMIEMFFFAGGLHLMQVLWTVEVSC